MSQYCRIMDSYKTRNTESSVKNLKEVGDNMDKEVFGTVNDTTVGKQSLQIDPQAKQERQEQWLAETLLGPERHPESDNLTTTDQYIAVQPNLVVYGAGLQVHKFTPSYDLCQVSLHMPIGTTMPRIIAMLQDQGLTNSDCRIRVTENGKFVEAIILTSKQLGLLLERKRNPFTKPKIVAFTVRDDAVWTPGAMKKVRPSLTLTWDSSPDTWDFTVATRETRTFARTVALPVYALSSVYNRLSDRKGVQMETCCITTSESKVLLTVEFDDWDNAEMANRDFKANRPGIPSFVMTILQPDMWSLTIPLLQFKAQSEQWSELTDTQHRNVRVEIKVINAEVFIRVDGQNKAAVGALRVRVEQLARGEVLGGVYWHPSFAYSEDSGNFFGTVARLTLIHITCHPDSHTLRVYGKSYRVTGARVMIRQEVSRREKVVVETTLNVAFDGFLARGGIKKVKGLVGEENIDWTAGAKQSLLRMKVGEEAIHHLGRLIKESLVEPLKRDFQDKAKCPICLTDTFYPEMLECRHGYCSACLNHFLKAAGENKKFPIICVGEGGTCGIPIALSFIRSFLPPHTFQQLVEAAFAAYLQQNPEFRYCVTPDCKQIYRWQPASRATTTNTCPSCFAKSCPSCFQTHENTSCLEEQERLNKALAAERGYKRCPRCTVWIDKIDGCNNVTCKCGKLFDWRQ